MSVELKGFNIVITGGSSGIGLATVEKILQYGGKAIILDLVPPTNTVEKKFYYYKTDVSNEEEVDKAFGLIKEEVGSIYGLVNNAAISPPPSAAENLSKDIIYKTFEVNVFGAFYCTKYAIPLMEKEGKGSVVNVSSVIGKVGSKNSSIYAASKSALIGMTKSNAVTYAQKNIRFNVVLPGYVRTPLIEKNANNSGNPLNYYKSLESLHPVGRLAMAEEIAEMIVYLLSEESSFVTGSEIVIDGGYTSV